MQLAHGLARGPAKASAFRQIACQGAAWDQDAIFAYMTMIHGGFAAM